MAGNLALLAVLNSVLPGKKELCWALLLETPLHLLLALFELVLMLYLEESGLVLKLIPWAFREEGHFVSEPVSPQI